MQRTIFSIVALSSLVLAGLVLAPERVDAAPVGIVQPADQLVLVGDCATLSRPIALITPPDDATIVEIGDDQTNEAGPGADAIRWERPSGSGFVSLVNCEEILVFTGLGGETVTIYGVDAASKLETLIVNTAKLDATAMPLEVIDEPGADTVIIHPSASTAFPTVISTLSGNDTIRSQPGHLGVLRVDSGPGNDNITTGSANDVIMSGPGGDTINSNNGNDTINAGTGNDTINSGVGDDDVFGEGGNDTINGGLGNDKLFGQGGNDILNGGPGNDVLRGGALDDQVTGGDGNDVMFGNTGADDMAGGAGNDRMRGQASADVLLGGDGNDLIIGGGGPDTHNGGAGIDRCFEGANQGLNETYVSCEIT